MNKKIEINYVYIIILLVLGVVLALYAQLRQEASFSAIFVNNKVITNNKYKIRDKIAFTAQFTSTVDYLGSVYIDFRDNFLVNGQISFKIKEKNDRDWIYVGLFNSNQFLSLPVYPFGFPIQANSKNKEYIFEISKTQGQDSLSIHPFNSITSVHQYPSSILKRDPKLFMYVIERKIFYYLGELKFYFLLIYFQIPLILYIVLKPKFIKIIFDEYIRFTRFVMFISIYLIIDIFIFRTYNEKTILLFLIAWAINRWTQNKKKSHFFQYALILASQIPILYFLNCIGPATKTAIYALCLLCLAIVSEIVIYIQPSLASRGDDN